MALDSRHLLCLVCEERRAGPASEQQLRSLPGPLDANVRRGHGFVVLVVTADHDRFAVRGDEGRNLTHSRKPSELDCLFGKRDHVAVEQSKHEHVRALDLVDGRGQDLPGQ